MTKARVSRGIHRASEPLVSAVIPSYNAAQFVGEAIESVLRQTYAQLECVVVDDGSTDGTADVVARFGDAVQVVRCSNGGVARARNLGISQARGEYVAFLDADDVWRPRKIEQQMRLFERRPELALVYSSVEVVDEEKRLIARVDAPEPCRALRNTLLLEPPPIFLAQTAVVSKEALDTVGGFDEQLSTSADTDLACRIASRFPTAGVREPFVLYRQHASQMRLDLVAWERDMVRVFDKLFGSGLLPTELQELEGRARANLHITLAMTYFKRREFGSALRHIRRAASFDSRRLTSVLVERLRGLKQRRP